MEDVIADKELVQQLGNIELANLQAAVKSQEKILESINRKLSGSMILGISNGNSRDRYRREIVKIIASMQDEKHCARYIHLQNTYRSSCYSKNIGKEMWTPQFCAIHIMSSLTFA